MFGSLSKRVGFALALAGSLMLAAPAGAQTSSAAPQLGRSNSMILCQPGFVLRCNKYGCHCQRA